MKKLNEFYISFKSDNYKMKNKCKKFIDFYFYEINNELPKREIENINNEYNISESEFNSIQTISHKYVDKIINHGDKQDDNVDSNKTISGLYLDEIIFSEKSVNFYIF